MSENTTSQIIEQISRQTDALWSEVQRLRAENAKLRREVDFWQRQRRVVAQQVLGMQERRT